MSALTDAEIRALNEALDDEYQAWERLERGLSYSPLEREAIELDARQLGLLLGALDLTLAARAPRRGIRAVA